MSPTPEMRRWRHHTLAICACACLAFLCIAAAAGYWFYVKAQDDIRASNNRTTCVSSVILGRLRASSLQAATDDTVSESSRARSSATATFESVLIGALRPIPPDLDCYALIGLPKPK